jgi:hypothetical protein
MGSIWRDERQPGKTASLEVTAKDGQIQDILLPPSTPNVPRCQGPSASGPSFHSTRKAAILEKVRLQGDFGMDVHQPLILHAALS